MLAVANANGFTEANQSVMSQLESDTSDMATNWTSYAFTMGYGIEREIIWGIYTSSSVSTDQTWAYAYNGGLGWRNFNTSYSMNLIAGGLNPQQQELGLWAYQTSSRDAVPEPATLSLAALGLLALAARLRKAK